MHSLKAQAGRLRCRVYTDFCEVAGGRHTGRLLRQARSLRCRSEVQVHQCRKRHGIQNKKRTLASPGRRPIHRSMSMINQYRGYVATGPPRRSATPPLWCFGGSPTAHATTRTQLNRAPATLCATFGMARFEWGEFRLRCKLPPQPLLRHQTGRCRWNSSRYTADLVGTDGSGIAPRQARVVNQLCWRDASLRIGRPPRAIEHCARLRGS